MLTASPPPGWDWVRSIPDLLFTRFAGAVLQNGEVQFRGKHELAGEPQTGAGGLASRHGSSYSLAVIPETGI